MPTQPNPTFCSKAFLPLYIRVREFRQCNSIRIIFSERIFAEKDKDKDKDFQGLQGHPRTFKEFQGFSKTFKDFQRLPRT